MSGSSWIKLRTNLHDDPRIDRIAEQCGVSNAEAFFAFVRLLCWADSVTEDGLVRHATAGTIDRRAGLEGLTEALEAVGWGTMASDGFQFCNYEQHNGSSAKRRANNAQSNADLRTRKKREQFESNSGASREQNCSPREEKRREEKKNDGASAPSAVLDADASKPAHRRSGSSKSKSAIRWTPETEFSGITDADRERWRKAYPAVDIDRQLAAMTAWLIADPRKAQKSNWAKFIAAWLSRNQDRGGDARGGERTLALQRDGPPLAPASTRQSERDRTNQQAIHEAMRRRNRASDDGEPNDEQQA